MTNNYLTQFPPDFLWGTATSSHQVEGGQWNNDWVTAENAGGMVWHDQRSANACGWWHNAEADFDRMAQLGMNTHRLSLEWSRIQPRPDTWDDAAIARYRQMLTGLIARGIQPMVTLHHFTNPNWVVAQGAWETEKIIELFSTYVDRIVGEFNDLVTMWCPINEPLVYASQGYLFGLWPPQQTDLGKTIDVAINMVRAHGQAYRIIHKHNPHAQVGIAKHMVVWNPRRPWLPIDHWIARTINAISNHNFLDAITTGVIRIPGRRPIDVPEAVNSLDWLGINYYQRYRIGIHIGNIISSLVPGIRRDWIHQETRKDMPKGPGSWGEFHPEGIYLLLAEAARYGVPLYITENGIPSATDPPRVSFLINHLRQLGRAIEEGIPVAGYYHWSLVDNFEWAEGFNPAYKFGLIEVNHDTQARTLKKSAQVYGEIIQQGGITQALVDNYLPTPG